MRVEWCWSLLCLASAAAFAQDAATPPAAAASEALAPAPPSCRALTDKAMAADMRALNAQSQKQDIAQQAQLFSEAVNAWSASVAVCEGRAKERAQRNLHDNQRISTSLAEQAGAGPECAAAHKDGSALQELARQALAERRWSDAAALFGKAEDNWDNASERCSGSQKELALRRREQAETDGYNAAHCAPLFDRARDYTQKMRGNAANLSKEERADALMTAETLWREAVAQCKGAAAKDSAGNNAQALGRERGTPFVAKALPAPVVAPPKPVAAPLATAAPKVAVAAPAAPVAQAAAPAPASASVPLPPPSKPELSGTALAQAFAAAFPTANQAAAAPVAATAPTPAAPVPQPREFMSGTTRFNGDFVADADGKTYSGRGKIAWANGDSFDGDLRRGQRHGKGLFIWANGNRYDGDWIDDKPLGKGKLQFANGNVYEGDVVAGDPKGQGKMAYASGDRYSGQFSAGMPDGKGIYTWKNGQQFDGDWKNGQPDGRGRMQFASGEVYEGEMRAGVPQGQGSFLWTNGDKFSGQWKDGKKHGEGTFTWKSGDYWQGVYDNDQQTANGNLIRK